MKHLIRQTFSVKVQFLLSLILLSASAIYSQAPSPLPNQKWNTVGNNASNTDFIGTTNNQSLVFKTNNFERIVITPNGDFILKKLAGIGDGLVIHDHDGKVDHIPFNNSFTQVLGSNGVWKEISTFTGLQVSNNDIIQTASGNFGIGTTAPQAKLDVNGTVNISGQLTAQQGLKFDNLNGISYATEADGSKTFRYGRTGGTLPVRSSVCAALPYNPVNHSFGGWVQIFSTDAAGNYIPGDGLLNFQTWGGGSSIDASIGGTSTSGGLLLNYFCGNKTYINTGTHGGDVQICSSGNVGIGISNPSEKLDVDGNVKLNSNTLFLKNDSNHGLKYANAFGGVSMDGPVLFGYSKGVLGTTNGGERVALFWDYLGKVGMPSLAGAGTNVIQVDNNGVLSAMPLTTAGVGFWNTSDGGNTIFHITGKVGIGTNTPADLFQVGDGCARLVSGNAGGADLNYGTSYIGFNADRNGTTWNFKSDNIHNGGAVMYANIFGEMYFSTIQNNNGSSEQTKTDAEILANTKLFISADGNVAIGTIHPDGYKFSVNGTMRAKDITVKLTGWSDFVFDESYLRMSLLDKEIFYKKEKHLPNINNADAIVSEGLQVGTTMNGMMQNIEENTLDLVDLYKKFLILEKENAELKQRITQLENSSN